MLALGLVLDHRLVVDQWNHRLVVDQRGEIFPFAPFQPDIVDYNMLVSAQATRSDACREEATGCVMEAAPV